MTFALALIGGLIGLFVTGAACFTAWLYQHQRSRLPQDAAIGTSEAAVFLRWTVMDYAILLLFGIGTMLLFTDLVSVMRDLKAYPPHHFGYLLTGFIFMFMGMLFMVSRLVLVMAMIKPLSIMRLGGSPSINQHDQPGYADQAE